MKRKLLSLFLVFVMVIQIIPINTVIALGENNPNYDGYCGDTVEYYFDDVSGILSIFGYGDMTDFSVSSPAPWSEFGGSVTRVIIQNGVSHIGNMAFASLINTDWIEISDSVTSIGNSAFNGCILLSSINIPESVKTIGEYAFYGCVSLQTIIIPDSVTKIGEYAFCNCIALECVDLSNSVTILRGHIFEGCSSLGVIEIPDSITEIGSQSFHSCSNLQNVIIPNTVTSIGARAFFGCEKLLSVSIPSSVSTIGYLSFGYGTVNSNFSKFDLSIYGESGSAAEEYALENDFDFVSELRIKSVVVEDVSVYEGTNGWYSQDWNEETQDFSDYYFYYDSTPKQIKITYSDGSTYTDSVDGLINSGLSISYWMENDFQQSYNNPLTVGKYSCGLSINNIKTAYTFEIVPTIVDSIYVEGNTQIKNNYNGGCATYPLNGITIYYKNGDVSTYDSIWDVESETGYPVFHYGDNGEQWQIGEHIMYASFMGVTSTYTITLVENPVEKIEVAPITIVENTNMGTDCTWIDDQPVQFPVYYYSISKFTVFYKDKTSETLTNTNTINIYGQDYYISTSDDQSYTNKWGTGTHTVHATLSGIAECDFEVNIVNSPIKNISVENMEIKEGENGWNCEEYDEYGNVVGTYFRYSSTPDNITITFNDDTSYTGSSWDIYEKYGFDVFIEDDQSFDNPWLPGLHTAKLSVAGKEIFYQINIIASPIRNVIVPCINLIKGADCTQCEAYDEYGNCIGIYEHYDIFPNQITVECTDGSSYTGEIWDVQNELGVSIWFNDDQSYDNQWGIGTHTAKIVVGGKSFNYDIVITESPIQYVAIDRITLIEGIDGYYYEGEFIYTLPENFEFVATLNDGTVVTSHNNKYGMPSIEIGNKSYSIDLSAFNNEDHSNWKAGNTYQVTAKLCGKPCVMYVKIVTSPYKSLSLEDSGDLYLVLTKKDGTQERQEVISFDARGMGEDGRFMGILTTDKAQYQDAIFTVDKPNEMIEKTIGFYLQCTNNLRLQIGELTSNSLEKSNWLAMQLSYSSIVFKIKMYPWYAEQLGHPFNGFDGTVAAENIDAIVTLAVNVCDYFGCGDIGEDGYPYGAFDAVSVKKDVEMLFGIKDIDLSGFSGYDASTGRVHVLWIEGGSGPTRRTLSYENGKWVIEYREYSDEELTSLCGYAKVILNSDAKVEQIIYSEKENCDHIDTEIRNAKSASCCEDGYTGDTYCIDCEEKISSGEIIQHTSKHTDADSKWETNDNQHWHTCYYGTQFDIENHSGGTATCKQKAICEECGVEYGDYAKHKLIKHEKVEPTVDNDGNIEYWTCDECSKYFSDAEGKCEITEEDIVIGKLTIKKLTYLDGEVLIEVPSNAVSEDFEITVDKIVPPPEEIVEKVKDTYGESSEVLAYYEIRLFDETGAQIYNLNSEITIKSILPEKYRTGYIIKISQEDDDGNLVEMESWREGEYICYKTVWLEKY